MKKDFIPDYMCTLQVKIFIEPRFPELEQEISNQRKDILQSMNKDGRHKLLEFIDATGELQGRITLAGFVAGFRLAGGIAKELSMEESYSCDKDEKQ